MKLKPLGDRLIVKAVEEDTTTASGIVLPDTAKEKPQRGRVLAVGPGARDEHGKHIELDVAAGDEVVYLLSGVVDMVLGESSGERIVALRAGTACVVPAGVWHSANVRVAGQALHITRGAGTQHRPRERR